VTLMATTYTTRQGETIDLACFAYYGRTAKVVEAVLEANRGLSALGPILPLGTQIIMPEMPSTSTAKSLTSLWD
jgi:phage tail protein X